jgi:transglutaminase-like putative cysteine protease
MADQATPGLDPRSRRWVLLSAGACLLPLLLQLPLLIAVTIALSAVAVVAMSWRQPLHGLLRLLLSVALIATVLAMSGFTIGRDTGCALLAAMLAIKPSETFSLRDARSLLGFALFAPFATFLLDQGPLSLALGLTATLLTMAALQLLADVESGDVRRDASAIQRMAGTGRLLALGLPLALAAFWLFPRLGSPLWGIPERAMASTGLSDRMSPGDWNDLMTDDRPALRARFFGPVPAQSQMYWRGPVMWDFDGRTWRQPRWMPGWTETAVEPGPQRWDYEIEMEPTDRRQLVALDLLMSAPGGSGLDPDHSLQAQSPLTGVTRWRMQSAPPRRYEATLSPQTRQYALRLPPNFNPRTLALARQWRLEAGPSADGAIVTRALDWIRRDFAYTLDTPLAGRNSVDEFLFDQRAGYCQHFSSSFVVLMRGAGIPARVVTGYAGGYRNSVGGYWLVRRSDAHAWAEVWLRGRGWVRVDPTAAVAPERIYDTLDDRRSIAGGLFAGGRSLIDVGDWMRRGWNDFVLGFDANRQQRLLRPFGIDRIDDRTLVLLLMLAVAVGLLWMVWFSRRNEREPDPVLRAWHALARRYRHLGLERAPDEPAGRWVERVAAARPELAGELRILSDRFSDWRYAGSEPGGRSTRALTQALRAHRPSPRNGNNG